MQINTRIDTLIMFYVTCLIRIAKQRRFVHVPSFLFFSYLRRSRVSMSRDSFVYTRFSSTYIRNQSFRIWKPHGWSAKSASTRCPWSTRLFHCSVSTFVTSIRFHYLSCKPYLGKRQFARDSTYEGIVARCGDKIGRYDIAIVARRISASVWATRRARYNRMEQRRFEIFLILYV